jgi:16S rRNA (cytosine1402-N4)-methyltransferase
VELAKKNLVQYKPRVSIHKSAFSDLDKVLDLENIDFVDCILMDLGVSSMQIDTANRGFSYIKDSTLDMRMDNSSKTSAKDVLNSYSSERLEHIFKVYGEEPFANRIATNITKVRKTAKLATSKQLVDAIATSLPARFRYNNLKNVKRVFQSLRIEVNDELGQLKIGLKKAFDKLSLKGVLVVETYHSLEDKAVKSYFINITTAKTPRTIPVEMENYSAMAKIIKTQKKADEKELQNNPRAKSARIRAIEKIKLKDK